MTTGARRRWGKKGGEGGVGRERKERKGKERKGKERREKQGYY